VQSRKQKETRIARVVLTDPNQNFLLAKQASRQLWHFPGGRIDANETPEQAALREMREEIKLRSRRVKLVHTELIQSSNHLETIYCYTGKAKQTDKMEPDGKEIDAIMWLPLHKMYEFELTDTTHLLLRNIKIISLFI
jgi:8-oxo-dGTP diphosphatase